MDIQQRNELTKQAQAGNLLAQKQLGIALSRCEDTLDEGIFWLKEAAKTDKDAMYALGRVYLKRKNNPNLAIAWYEQAATCGQVDAMVDMGAVYLYGFQVPASLETAVQWYRRAAEQKSPVAIYNLGFLSLRDPELLDTAVNFLRKSADLGYADGAYLLGVLHYQGVGVAKDPAQTLAWLTRAFELGKHYTARPLGDLHFQGYFSGGVQDPEAARRWYERGAEHQVLSCLEVLADYHYFGFGGTEDFAQAYDYARMADQLGSADAALILGFMYMQGQGVPKNLRQALKWMEVAHHRGQPKAEKFVHSLQDILGNSGPAAYVPGQGGPSGIHLSRSRSDIAEAAIREQEVRQAQKRLANASIYAAAGAMSGDGSYTDYDMGAVISADGEVSYVDTDLGIIMGPDGDVSSHDAKSGMTYNWSTGQMLCYDEMFGATMDLSSGRLSYHRDGHTF